MITMSTPDWDKLASAYCKAHGKWGVCVNLHYDIHNHTWDTFRAALDSDLPLWCEYWATPEQVLMAAINEYPAIFLCDTEEEMMAVYHKVRGQDGLPGDPTPGRFYASTYTPDGTGLTENT